MLDSNVKRLLNEQVNKEFYSAYLYLDFSNFYKSKGLDGFANWYNVQAQEERDHALLFMQYLQNNNETVALEAIAKPDVPMSTLMEPLKAGLKHEEYVTSLIHALYAASQKVNDYRTMQFLDWFVKEQGEEETNANDLITKMELFGADAKGLYMLDAELKARTYTHQALRCKPSVPCAKKINKMKQRRRGAIPAATLFFVFYNWAGLRLSQPRQPHRR